MTLDLEQFSNVFAQKSIAILVGKLPRQRFEVHQVVRCVVGMGVVRSPEELCGAIARNERSERMLVGVTRDPAPVPEIRRRLLLELHADTDRSVGVHRIHPIEEMTDPAPSRFEHQYLEAGELIEHGHVEKCGQLMSNAIATSY